ncbi:hypothetical protein [Nakamurella sp.]|uniref:hypothetical protein n=1 Tax=Nakamurella sp. TaxID=1869182 RepID=UPI003B3B6347
MADGTRATARRRGVNWIGLIFSLIFLSVASAGFSGDPWWLLNTATKWVLAGVVAAIGIGLLVTALPGRGRQRS